MKSELQSFCSQTNVWFIQKCFWTFLYGFERSTLIGSSCSPYTNLVCIKSEVIFFFLFIAVSKSINHVGKYTIEAKFLWQLCATMMSWVGCLLKDSELFILFAENSQILLKIFVIPILLTFIYLVALNLLVNNQLKSSSNSTHHCVT